MVQRNNGTREETFRSLYNFWIERYIESCKGLVAWEDGKSLNAIRVKIEEETSIQFDEFKRNEERQLQSMLKSILGSNFEMNLFKQGNTYQLDSYTCDFFEFLIDTYKDRDAKLIRSKKYDEVDDGYLTMMRDGVSYLLDNYHDLINEGEVMELWEEIGCDRYRQMMDSFRSLEATVKYFGNLPNEYEANLDIFNFIKKSLDECTETIKEYALKRRILPDVKLE